MHLLKLLRFEASRQKKLFELLVMVQKAKTSSRQTSVKLMKVLAVTNRQQEQSAPTHSHSPPPYRPTEWKHRSSVILDKNVFLVQMSL